MIGPKQLVRGGRGRCRPPGCGAAGAGLPPLSSPRHLSKSRRSHEVPASRNPAGTPPPQRRNLTGPGPRRAVSTADTPARVHRRLPSSSRYLTPAPSGGSAPHRSTSGCAPRGALNKQSALLLGSASRSVSIGWRNVWGGICA